MDKLTFFRQALVNYRDTGSIVPSSLYLAQKLTAPIFSKPDLVVVELGPGTGSVTHHLLNILPGDAKLISIELNHVLVEHLRKTIHDERLTIVEGNAMELRNILDKKSIGKVDYIVSGIPLGNLSSNTCLTIYEQIKSSLKSDGIYTQFQYLLANYRQIKKNFRVIDVVFEWRNIPPAFVYTSKLL